MGTRKAKAFVAPLSFLVLCIFGQSTTGIVSGVDNQHTLRYDGEVNIGKTLFIGKL